MDATAAFYQALAESEAEDANAALAAEAAQIAQTTAAPDDAADAAETYEFRWDVEVPGGERRYGQKFMKQWKRVLQVQKLSPLVTAKLAPHHARFQLCVGPDISRDINSLANAPSGAIDTQASPSLVAVCEAEVAEVLAGFRWAGSGSARSHIDGEPARQHPAGWQGVRVWMTFARRDVEAVLGKKPKI